MSYAPEAGGARKRVIRADANKALIFLMRRQTSRRLSMIILLGTVMASEAQTPTPTPRPHYDVIDLGTLGGPSSSGTGINNSGQVTGGPNRVEDSPAHAFLYSAGGMTDLVRLEESTVSVPESITRASCRSIFHDWAERRRCLFIFGWKHD